MKLKLTGKVVTSDIYGSYEEYQVSTNPPHFFDRYCCSGEDDTTELTYDFYEKDGIVYAINPRNLN